jgi:hypothetical protein
MLVKPVLIGALLICGLSAANAQSTGQTSRCDIALNLTIAASANRDSTPSKNAIELGTSMPAGFLACDSLASK